MRVRFYNKILSADVAGANGNDIVTIAMADDHTMLRRGLASLIESFGNYRISIQAANGKELIEMIASSKASLPDIALLDINMPEMDGYKTAAYIQQHYPSVKMLALSMMDDEKAIIQMIKNGARGYVLKDAEPSELRLALNNVITKGYHYSELVTGKLIFSINKQGSEEKGVFNHGNTDNFSAKELDFLRHVCTELTYKEIAEEMNVSPRTIDGYRDALFDRLGIKTRVGLAMYAIKKGIVDM